MGDWSEPTIVRIAQGLLSTLRDFGILQGAVNKKIAPAYFPVESFAYLVFYLKQRQPSGAKLIELSDWKLFFLSREGVERFLFEAHQRDLLEYHVAGSITRLTRDGYAFRVPGDGKWIAIIAPAAAGGTAQF